MTSATSAAFLGFASFSTFQAGQVSGLGLAPAAAGAGEWNGRGCGGDGFAGSPELCSRNGNACGDGANQLLQGLASSFGQGGANGGANGGVIELQEGQTYTTRGGTTINFEGGKKGVVDIDERGQGGHQLNCGGGDGREAGVQGAFAMGAAQSGVDGGGHPFSAAVAMAGTFASAGQGGSQHGCQQQGGGGSDRHTHIYGDPHIKYGDGKKANFKEKNAEFMCQDGTRVVAQAGSAHGKVKKVTVFLPGSGSGDNAKDLASAGIDPSKTGLMQGNGGHFDRAGKVSEARQH